MSADTETLLGAGLAATAAVMFLFRRYFRPGEESLGTFIRTGLTIIVLCGFAAKVGKLGTYAPAVAALVGIILGAIWASSLGEMVSRPFTSLFDGGDIEPDIRPLYSIAQAKRQRGKYDEAIAEVHKQLVRFPKDFQGWMMIAEIYAEDLKDIESAREAISEILAHQNHAPKNVSYALTRLAEWYLSLKQDRSTAEDLFREIEQRFEGTEFAMNAAQRRAHLTTDKMLAAMVERPRINVVTRDHNIGLEGMVADPRPEEVAPGQVAARLLEHLAEHPLDWEAREQLAKIYAEHYQRLDLAAEQIEILVGAPNQTQKNVANWLNTLADFQVKAGNGEAGVMTLDRIKSLYPKTAVAANAEKRIAYMSLELRKNEKSQVLQLGSYEENIGLKDPRLRG